MKTKSTKGGGIVYDAVAILGFGPASAEPLPKAAPGEIVIRVGAWSFKDLRTMKTILRKQLMWNQDSYDEYPWSSSALIPGIYRLRLPVPDSNFKTFAKQQKLLLPGEDVAPVALVVTALLCSLKQAGKDLLDNNWTRCAETLPDGDRVALKVREDLVRVRHFWDDSRSGRLWLSSACRKS